MEKDTGKVREFCQPRKVGTLLFSNSQTATEITSGHVPS